MSASPARSQPEYVTFAGDVRRDREAVLAAWRGNIGQEQRHASKFDWFYRACPFGEPLVRLLRHAPTGALVGVGAAGQRRMFRAGRELRAGVLVDLAVATEHRSLGPAITLQKALMSAGEERLDLLYGFPNPKAAPVFKRVGYEKIGELVRYARVLRYRRQLPRVMPPAAALPLGVLLDGATRIRQAVAARRARDLRTEWVDEVVPEMDDLWRRSDHGEAAIAARDTVLLRWRFDEAPLPRTRYLLVRDATSGVLEAWFACQPDGADLHIRDFWSIDAAEGVGERFIDALARAARRAGHALLSVEYAGPAPRVGAWLDAGFVPRSRRPIFGKWSRSAGEGRQLHLTAADEDE